MKKASLYSNLSIIAGVISAAAIGAWALRHHPTGVAPTTASAATAMVAQLSGNAGPTKSDQEVAKWAQKVQAEPKNVPAWSALGDALMQKARETADVGYYARAEKAYRQALSLNPKDLAATVGMAWINGGRHEFEQSIDWAQKALAIDPKSDDAYGLWGDADVEMGNYDAAFEHYQQMLDIRPALSSYSRGAHLLWLTGDIRKAVLLMAKAIKDGAPYAENTAWCRAQLALILFNTGALPAAQTTIDAAVKIAPHNYQVLAALGKIKAAEKDYPAAIDAYRQSVAAVPTIDAVSALGDLYRLTGKSAEAEKQYALVESIYQLQKSNGIRGDLQTARFYAEHDRNLPDALKMEQAEYQTRRNVYVADTLAWCLYKNGRYEEAKSMIEQALQKHTPEALFRFHAGMIYAKLNDRRDAQIALYQALSSNPNFSPVYSQVAVDTLQSLGSNPPSEPAKSSTTLNSPGAQPAISASRPVSTGAGSAQGQ